MDETQKNARFSAFRNWISLAGVVVAMGSLFSFILLFAMEFISHGSNPYLGILTFVVAPAFLAFGAALMLGGWAWQRMRIIKGKAAPFVQIDFSRADHRRNAIIFILCAAVFLMVSAIGSYESYHFAESTAFCGQTCHEPMKPEFTAYLNSPHAHVGCTECHVGPGAVGYIKAKLNGVNQLQQTILNTYSRPIPAPKHNHKAEDTCERCHWPKKYIGNKDKTFTHFLQDETNTANVVRMAIKVGGGDPTHGPVGGVHWHMNIDSKVEYIATDDKKQEIPFVRLTNNKGEVTEFRSPNFKDDPAKFTLHKMDCLDCHNRPAHQFRPIGDAIDMSLSLKRIDPSIPLIKSNLVSILSHTNATEAEGLNYIATTLRQVYTNDLNISPLIAEAQNIFKRTIFPEMKSDWRKYPDNIGHKNFPGCFRCHDGTHKTADSKRKIEASDCNSCHEILGQSTGTMLGELKPGVAFAHPDPSSEGKDPNCFSCHPITQ